MRNVFRQKTKHLLIASTFTTGVFGAHTAFAQTEATPAIATVETTKTEQTVKKPNSHLSLNGAVGLTLNPTADLPAPDEVRVQFDYFDLGELDNDSDTLPLGPLVVAPSGDHVGNFQFAVLHAATRVKRSRLEISGGIERMRAEAAQAVDGSFAVPPFFSLDITSRVDHDDLNKTRPAIGAKYLLLGDPDDADATHVAIGGGYNPALFGNVNAYVVASKPFQIGGRKIKAHLGGRYDRFKFESHLLSTASGAVGFPVPTPFAFTIADENFTERSSKFSAFAGVELPITRSGQFSFVGEIGSRNSDFHGDGRTNIAADLGLTTSKFPYSAALRYTSNSGLNISAGVMRQGVLDGSGPFVQAGFGF